MPSDQFRISLIDFQLQYYGNPIITSWKDDAIKAKDLNDNY